MHSLGYKEGRSICTGPHLFEMFICFSGTWLRAALRQMKMKGCKLQMPERILVLPKCQYIGRGVGGHRRRQSSCRIHESKYVVRTTSTNTVLDHLFSRWFLTALGPKMTRYTEASPLSKYHHPNCVAFAYRLHQTRHGVCFISALACR